MGADLIIATLWATLGPEHEHIVQDKPFMHRDPLLDWQAGHDYIDTLTWDRDTIKNAAGWSSLALSDDEEVDLDEGDISTLVQGVRKELHGQLNEMQQSIEGGSRDVDARIFGDCIMFLSGGPSWGDSPTEAAELWWYWDEVEEYLPDIGIVPSKVGFWWMGSDDAPFEIVRKQ